MTVSDGTDVFAPDKAVTSARLNKTVLWRGTSLPVGAANKIPKDGFFVLVDSMTDPTTFTFYIQTSEILSSPDFKPIIAPDSDFPDGLGSLADKVEVGSMSRTAHTDFPTAAEDWAWGAYSSGNYTEKTSAPSSIVDLDKGTWVIWFKLTSTSTIQAIASISKATTTTSQKDNYFIHYRGDLSSPNKRIEIALDVAGTRVMNCYTNTEINDTNWHMIAVVSTGSLLKVYLDGILQTLTFDTGSNLGQFFYSATNADRLNDGSTYSSATRVNPFTGYLDEQIIWSEALSGAEISSLYNSGAGELPQNIHKSGLLAYWKYEEDPASGSGVTVVNSAIP
ncbi:MAG: LamG domain-containing protein [Nitrosarchaeum sp.]|nr:LamG domain-containing protein [Nitrosarchaeum sp.]